MARTHVALLRGINVGGKNRLAMADLVALCEAVGCRDVATYIQSGNVAFQASATLAKQLPGKLSAAIAKKHKLEVPVIVRSADQLAAVVASNPYLRAKHPIEQLHVVFLADTPSPAAARALDPKRSPPDEFVVHGGELYLRCPAGVGNSKLTNAYFDAKLVTTSTARNWKTVLALDALLR
jgi:uncharacterized protein (DUF1697 family)